MRGHRSRVSKTCFKCHAVFSLSEFYTHSEMADGHLGKCKRCTKKDVSARYRATRPAKAAYERERNARPERKRQVAECQRRRRAREPAKTKAHNAVSNAIRDGRLHRQPCQLCGAAKVQAHHPDYSKPLDVEWLCFKCHREARHGQVTQSRTL